MGNNFGIKLNTFVKYNFMNIWIHQNIYYYEPRKKMCASNLELYFEVNAIHIPNAMLPAAQDH